MRRSRSRGMVGVASVLMWLVFANAVLAQSNQAWRAMSRLPLKQGKAVVQVRMRSPAPERLELDYALPPVAVADAEQDSNTPAAWRPKMKGLKRIQAGNAPVVGHAGWPVLPVIPAAIVLPDGPTVD
ncbi:MAG: hypothetical protein V2A34_01570, partial [Lentisphaerota bacterium]